MSKVKNKSRRGERRGEDSHQFYVRKFHEALREIFMANKLTKKEKALLWELFAAGAEAAVKDLSSSVEFAADTEAFGYPSK